MTVAEKKKNKKSLHSIHQKYYGSRKEKPGAKEALAEKTNQVLAERGPSRNSLMLKAKAAGIKYFRIMTKEELFQVLDHPGDIVKIQEQAQARWKAGWGKGKAKNAV